MKKTDWIQSVYSTTGINGNQSNEWFNDYSKDQDNAGKNINRPFYYDKARSTKAWRRDMDATFGGRVFHDGPNRLGYASSNFSWNAQLSLVGLRNGNLENNTNCMIWLLRKCQYCYLSPMLLNHISNTAPKLFSSIFN